MRKIMVGVDGSPASLDALTWAYGLAASEVGATVLVASVIEAAPPGVPAPPADAEVLRRQRRELAHAWCGGPAGPAGADAAQLLVLEGRPGPALVDAAAAEGADLVILGTGGTRAHADPMLGSVARFVARHVAAPFLAVPVGCRWRRPRHVVIGVDGSEGSQAAVTELAALVDGRGDTVGPSVTALYACQPLTEWAGQPSTESWRRAAAHDLSCWTAALPAGRLRQVVADEGHPSALILGAARQKDADLVVAGVQATSRVSGTRAGSTAFQLLESATTATLLVPPRRRCGPSAEPTVTIRSIPEGGNP